MQKRGTEGPIIQAQSLLAAGAYPDHPGFVSLCHSLLHSRSFLVSAPSGIPHLSWGFRGYWEEGEMRPFCSASQEEAMS